MFAPCYYINPTIARAEELGATCHRYMDDLVVILSSEEGAQPVIDCMAKTAFDLSMSFNISKCGAKTFTDCTLYLNNEAISKVTENTPYKYLGTLP